MKYHFITFATDDHMSFAQQNVESALSIGKFDTTTIYTMNDLDQQFKEKNQHILNHTRGSGYWLWKPYIIFKKLLEIDENDILCYNDSKFIWLKDVRDYETNILSTGNIGGYLNKPNGGNHIEKQWTKSDAYTIMNVKQGNIKNSFANSNQIWAGLLLLRKSFNSIRFIGEWLTYCQDDRIITDSKSLFGPEYKEFIETRHDQTILSLLFKKWNIPMHTIDKSYMIDVRNPI